MPDRMEAPPRWVQVALAIVAVLAVAALLPVGGSGAGAKRAKGITPEIRAAGPSFAAGVTPGQRAWILAAIAEARPEAQRLVHEIDGLVTFEVLDAPGGSMEVPMGITQYSVADGPGPTRIGLNMRELDGRRTIDRSVVVLHELGHALDPIVPQATNDVLERGVPRTGTCMQMEGHGIGACTAPEERFADTFAKWALRGRVSEAGSGYGIAMPASLEDWGAPLTSLALTLPSS
jgi:hypothetical protein